MTTGTDTTPDPARLGTNGYLTTGVTPVGQGAEAGQQAAVHGRYPTAAFTDAVQDGFDDPVASYNPATQTWNNPQAADVDVPFPNTLALAYAAPGSADVAGAPGRPVPFGGLVDGSAPSIGGLSFADAAKMGEAAMAVSG